MSGIYIIRYLRMLDFSLCFIHIIIFLFTRIYKIKNLKQKFKPLSSYFFHIYSKDE